MHGQRCHFGTYKGTEVSFWYIQRDRGVVLVHKKGQRRCFGAGYIRGVLLVHSKCILYSLDSNTKLLCMKNRTKLA